MVFTLMHERLNVLWENSKVRFARCRMNSPWSASPCLHFSPYAQDQHSRTQHDKAHFHSAGPGPWNRPMEAQEPVGDHVVYNS